MGQPAAKQGDKVTATDIHIILVPAAGGAPVLTPRPLPFCGILQQSLSTDVSIERRAAATVGSVAINTPPHTERGPGKFVNPPSNRGTIIFGSTTVCINGKQAARAGDTAMTCNDPVDLPVGTVVAQSTVRIGG